MIYKHNYSTRSIVSFKSNFHTNYVQGYKLHNSYYYTSYTAALPCTYTMKQSKNNFCL